MVNKKITIGGIAAFATVMGVLHTTGYLPMVQAQGEELKQMIQGKPDAREMARHMVIFYQGELRTQLNDLDYAMSESERDPTNIKKREAITIAEIAVAATREEIKNQYRIWKGSE